jgi:hypothetical protein
MRLKTIFSKRAVKLYYTKVERVAQDFVFKNNQKRSSYGPARLRKVHRPLKTTYPDFVMPYNKWTEEYNVSSRIPK